MSLTTRVLAALVLGLIVGLVILSYPSPTLQAVVTFIEPIGMLWVNALRMTVVPLVFSLLVAGVASSGNMQAVRSIGVRAILVFLALLIAVGVISLVVVPPMFAGLRVDESTVAALRRSTATVPPPVEASYVSDWILSIIPTNPIKAAADGALLPL